MDRDRGGYTPQSAPKNPTPPQGGSGTAPPIEVGDDGFTRLEKDLGLDIDPKTGRAYESQGDFTNVGLGVSGRFHDGQAVPRVFKCSACERMEAEPWWGSGVQNWGCLVMGGQWAICCECVLKILHLFPQLRGKVAAMNGGNLRSRG